MSQQPEVRLYGQPCGCAIALATHPDGRTMLGMDPACRHHRPVQLPEQRDSGYAELVQRHVHERLRVVHAIEDTLMVGVLAAHPWFLYWLARTPGWAAYAATHR